MKKEEFMYELAHADNNIDEEWLSKLLDKSIDSNLDDGNPRGHKNLIVTIEELSELTKEISKKLRGSCDYYNLLQELADVCMGIGYIRKLCHIDDKDLYRAINVKAKRLEDVLNKHGKYE